MSDFGQLVFSRTESESVSASIQASRIDLDALKHIINGLVKALPDDRGKELRDSGEFSRLFSPDRVENLFSAGDLSSFAKKLKRLAEEVVQENGKVTVRYLGDLKTFDYDLSTRMFHLTGASTGEEFREMLVDAMMAGKDEAVLINLRNVRDVRIKIGNSDVPGLEKNLKEVHRAADVMTLWSTSKCFAKRI